MIFTYGNLRTFFFYDGERLHEMMILFRYDGCTANLRKQWTRFVEAKQLLVEDTVDIAPPPPPPAAAPAPAFLETPPQVNVEGLSKGINSRTLRELFTPYGHIVNIVVHNNSGGRFGYFCPRVEESYHDHLCHYRMMAVSSVCHVELDAVDGGTD
ncbi:Splicing factor-like protein [Trema orientale]|uniref:Splicing factor-like protein n=1 Tax=Trema orientale TaxID=63057 RepID=A0A2P5CFS2_TREOI|nr:Splicing factor-like protein [Trema orientale]